MEKNFNIIKVKTYDEYSNIVQESSNHIINDKIEIVIDGNFLAINDEGTIRIGNRIYFIFDNEYKSIKDNLRLVSDTSLVYNFNEIKYITCVNDVFIILTNNDNIEFAKTLTIKRFELE